MRTCVVIPAYNEAYAIGRVVSEARRFVECVLVIDDASTDETAAISKSFGASIIRHRKNLGKGASLRRGFQWAMEKDFDAIITIDGDGQHDPEEIPLFLEEAKHSEAQLIIGNRMNDASRMPIVRRFTNWFMSSIISKLIKKDIFDSQCGYRLIKRGFLEKADLTTSKYEIESELLIRASESRVKIASIPVKTIYKGEASLINPVIDTYRFIRFVLRNLRRLKRKRSELRRP